MPTSAFFAVLRDVTKLTATAADDMASQASKLLTSADDIAVMGGKATAKTAGVAGDDLAVGAGQVGGLAPNREIPAVLRIARGSALNKAWLALVLLVVSEFLPVAITVALAFGALYLAYEGGEGLLERLFPHADGDDDDEANMTEDQKVKSAIRTDLVLSLEILVIAMSTLDQAPLPMKVAVLFVVAVVMTVGVYGLIALIIRLDDMGLKLMRSESARMRSLGSRLVKAAPVILRVLEPVGMVAMFMVAGGIFAHMLHLDAGHWTLGLVMEAAIGVVAGLVLAGGHMLVNKLRGAH